MKHFHNTVHISGSELVVKEGKCKNQEITILAFFEKYPNESFTPFQVQEGLQLYRTPITSIRRAISDLTDAGYLTKTNIQAMGIYDTKNYKWTFKKGQRTLF